MPSEADELASSGDEESLRRALELDPGHAAARRQLARLLLGRGDAAAALELLEDATGDFLAEGLAARAASRTTASRRVRGLGPRRHREALERLQAALSDPERRDDIRRIMVAIFTELGPQDELASEYRRRLAPR